MNYRESANILKEIKKAKRILVNCHRSPDPDSIGSALGLYGVLKQLGKEVETICPSDEISQNLSFLENFDKIKFPVDFSKFDFSKFDLFIVLDSFSWDMVADSKSFTTPKLPVVVIDHHKTNTKYGDINIVDDTVTSVGELLYLVLEDCGVEINRDVATSLLTGIIGDTGVFRYPGTGAKTLMIATKLMEKGADKDEIVFNLYHSAEFELVKFWGEILRNIEIDKKYKFVWSAMPYETYKKIGSLKIGRESSASLFAQIVKDTDFGILMVEQEKQKLSISFRSRTGLDTSQIAKDLGGGGHIYASGTKIEGLPFEKAVEKVLEVARKHAKKTS